MAINDEMTMDEVSAPVVDEATMDEQVAGFDLAAWVDNTVSWEWKYYYQIADAMKKAALELKIPIEWGGDWKTFKDGPHFQLPWGSYK